MNIRLEGMPDEISEARRRLRSGFVFKKPSKFYPNARGSVTDGSGRVYITIDAFEEPDAVGVLTNDLLSLAAKHDRLDEKSGMIRDFHEAGWQGMAFGKLFALYAAIRDNIMSGG